MGITVRRPGEAGLVEVHELVRAPAMFTSPTPATTGSDKFTTTGTCDDVNGNGEIDFDDVVRLFNRT